MVSFSQHSQATETRSSTHEDDRRHERDPERPTREGDERATAHPEDVASVMADLQAHLQRRG